MADENINKKSIGSYFTKKVITILAACVTVLSLIGGIWKFEAHYATNTRVDNVAVAAENDVNKLEMQLAGALQNQQFKSDAKYWQFMYERLIKDLTELKRQMIRYPEDDILKEDYRALLDRIKNARTKLDESIEKIN